MHRDYETNAPVQFYEYDDRIEILNPGGLYGKARPENFPDVNDYRNPFIAEAMKVLGYVNRFSRGVSRVQKELNDNGNGEAVFDLSLVTAFKVIENLSAKYVEAGFDSDTTQENTQEIVAITQETDIATQENTQETDVSTQEMILQAIKTNPKITRNELAKLLDRTPDSVKHHLSQLVRNGVLKHIGSTKSGSWLIIKDL